PGATVVPDGTLSGSGRRLAFSGYVLNFTRHSVSWPTATGLACLFRSSPMQIPDDNSNRESAPLRLPRPRTRRNTALRAQRMTMDRSRLKLDIVSLCLFFATVFLALCLLSYDPADPPSTLVSPNNSQVHNLCGAVGAKVAYGVLAGVGGSALVLLLGLVCLDILLFARHRVSEPVLRVLGW